VTRGFGEQSKGLKIPKTFDAALKVVVPAIREVADYAATKGVKTSLENHGFYMQESRRVEKLIKTVKHPNFGLTIDMGNFLCVNEDPVQAVKRVAKYAQMAHVKDFHLRPKMTMPPSGWFATPTEIALRGAIVGHGVIDVPKQIELLKKSGYDGYLSLEFEGMEEPLTAVRLGLEYLRPLV
jgi:sugar phosphate isomerase/epimerase